MADHLDAPGLTSPDGDPRTDITDLYAFQKPDDADRSILIVNVNPLAPTLAGSFRSTAAYDLLIDVDGDASPEVLFRTRFSPFDDGGQMASVYRFDLEALRREPVDYLSPRDILIFPDSVLDDALIIADAPVSLDGEESVVSSDAYQFFAGIRSDPFFFDLMGFLHNFQFTGDDFFADKNVFSIVLDVPNEALGSSSRVGVWARTLVSEPRRRRGAQADRMGRPAINTVFNHGEDKNTFNETQPDADRALFLDSFVATLQSLGGYSPDQATEIAEILLPDILTYDSSSAEGFLNGRKLTDDVIDIELSLVTNGQITSDGVGSHTDLLDEFPYMGPPH